MVLIFMSINIPNNTMEVVGDTNFLLFSVKPNWPRRSTKIEKQGEFLRGCHSILYPPHN